MQPSNRPDRLWVAGLVLLALWFPGKVSVWLDDQGRPVLSNQDAPEEAESLEAAEIAARWRGQWEGEPLRTPGNDPLLRQLAAARDDLRQGERRRALAALRRLARAHPSRPETHWSLGLVEMARGRHAAALESIDTALALAADMPEGWRARAQEIRGRIASELAHAETLREGEATPYVQQSEHFRLHYDHPFAGRGYGDHVLLALEHIRIVAERDLGRTLDAPLDVNLYTRADYRRDFGHRFGFGTVGFYDGTIHVVAARRPERRLAALLAHEYVHALFLRAVGSHRPFFLNEGLAERAEERAQGRPDMARGDWRRLADAVRAGDFIPLRDLVDAFNRLEKQRVPLAYLQSRAVVQMLEEREPGTLARWLERCADGTPWRSALETETGLTLRELDSALREEILGRFTSVPESILVEGS